MEAKPMHGAVIGEVADLLVSLNFSERPEPFRFSKAVEDRYEFLVERKKNDLLTIDEAQELELILALNHIFYVAKIKSMKTMTALAA